jgi:hypothetical protein
VRLQVKIKFQTETLPEIENNGFAVKNCLYIIYIFS